MIACGAPKIWLVEENPLLADITAVRLELLGFEVEKAVTGAEARAAVQNQLPDVIIIEGQGALSHPAYLTSTFIMRGAQPDAVILQHAPARRFLCDFPKMPTPTAATPAAALHLVLLLLRLSPELLAIGSDDP